MKKNKSSWLIWRYRFKTGFSAIKLLKIDYMQNVSSSTRFDLEKASDVLNLKSDVCVPKTLLQMWNKTWCFKQHHVVLTVLKLLFGVFESKHCKYSVLYFDLPQSLLNTSSNVVVLTCSVNPIHSFKAQQPFKILFIYISQRTTEKSKPIVLQSLLLASWLQMIKEINEYI